MEAGPTIEQKEQAQQPDRADLVVGIVSDLTSDILAKVRDAIGAFPSTPRVVVLQSGAIAEPAEKNGSSAGEIPSVSLIPWPTGGADGSGTRAQSISTAYQTAFALSKKLNARACCVIASQAGPDTPRWVSQLAQPVLGSECDFVAPEYARGKFQGLLNTSLISPLTRALYGKRIQNPLGPDLAFSERLYTKLSAADEKAPPANSLSRLLAAAAPTAVCDNLQIRQVQLGARAFPPPDWTNVSTILVQALGPIFAEMEKRAIYWQRARGSVHVPSDGQPASAPNDPVEMDTAHMIESFQLGVRDLQDIWGLVLPPATLLELRKLSRLSADQFRINDELWARIIFDFALAYRLRTMNRDHLLRSMTPLYLAWVASFALSAQSIEGPMVEQRFEKLALAFESNKPYLVSRWRWPDRFNP